MRKLKLAAEELVVESFEPLDLRKVQKGTINGNESDWEPATNDPRLRQCVTPYIECATIGWTCNWQCGVGGPLTTEC